MKVATWLYQLIRGVDPLDESTRRVEAKIDALTGSERLRRDADAASADLRRATNEVKRLVHLEHEQTRREINKHE